MSIDPKAINLPPKAAAMAAKEWVARGMTETEFMVEMAGRLNRANKAPDIGEMAKDFELELLDSNGVRTGEYQKLSTLNGKPVGLIFGSYTCPFFRQWAGQLNDIVGRFSDHVHFLGVYIREAHASDAKQVPRNIKEGVVYAAPTNDDERAAIAADCIKAHDISFPVVIDDTNDSVEFVYKAKPIRLFIIDPNGIVAYRSGPGPHYFDAEEWETALELF